MKRLLLLILFSTLTFINESFAQSNYQTVIVGISPTTKLHINGEANITKFTCTFNAHYLRRNKSEIRFLKKGNNIDFNNAVLDLMNEAFDCGSNAINKDFHALLKTKQHPKITLELNKVILKTNNSGEAFATITIAGVKRGYSFPIKFNSNNKFSGKLSLNIRDFKLQPPKKLMGLIVIKDNIEINFDIVTKEL